MTIYTAIGLMSGTSLDGIDVARIRTDGHTFVETLENKFYPYSEVFRNKVRESFGLSDREDARVVVAEKLITHAHIEAVKAFNKPADLIGFHGQTIFHDPANRITVQIGDGELMAQETGIDVVYDFRSNDVRMGGQGAPLLPLYHHILARSAKVVFPCAILNIGGVANITYMGLKDDIIAFDTGPGNALIDDWMLEKTQKPYDKDGQAALAGEVNQPILKKLLQDPYFDLKVPKSLDRDYFTRKILASLPVNEGAATLAEFTVAAIAKGIEKLPHKPQAVYVTGGGRKNKYIMQKLGKRLGILTVPVDEMGWNGDAMEAQGFAYLAARTALKLPITLPTTTGCPMPLTGGRIATSKAD